MSLLPAGGAGAGLRTKAWHHFCLGLTDGAPPCVHALLRADVQNAPAPILGEASGMPAAKTREPPNRKCKEAVGRRSRDGPPTQRASDWELCGPARRDRLSHGLACSRRLWPRPPPPPAGAPPPGGAGPPPPAGPPPGGGGARVAQWFKGLTLDFTSGHDLSVSEIQPGTDSAEPLRDSLYPSLFLPPPLSLSLPLSQNR